MTNICTYDLQCVESKSVHNLSNEIGVSKISILGFRSTGCPKNAKITSMDVCSKNLGQNYKKNGF